LFVLVPAIAGRGVEDWLPTQQAVTSARKRLGSAVLWHLQEQVVRPLATRATRGAWFKDWRVMLIDGTTLALIDTAANLAAFGGPGKTAGVASFPMSTAVVLVECGTRVIVKAAMGAYTTGERHLAGAILSGVHRGMLCLCDREYIGYPWLHALRQTGAHALIRVRSNMVLPVRQRLADGSYLSHIAPPQRERSCGARAIPVRVIEYRVAGSDECYRLITTLMHPCQASAEELAALYHERWEVETTLREVKAVLRGGSAKTVRSKTPDLVRQELAALLLAHYVLRRAIHAGALDADIDPDTVSFTHAVAVLQRKLPQAVGCVSAQQVNRVWAAFRAGVMAESVASSRGHRVERGVRRLPKYPVRPHGPTTPRQQDTTITLEAPAMAA
jgi:hypothetical protein